MLFWCNSQVSNIVCDAKLNCILRFCTVLFSRLFVPASAQLLNYLDKPCFAGESVAALSLGLALPFSLVELFFFLLKSSPVFHIFLIIWEWVWMKFITLWILFFGILNLYKHVAGTFVPTVTTIIEFAWENNKNLNCKCLKSCLGFILFFLSLQKSSN